MARGLAEFVVVIDTSTGAAAAAWEQLNTIWLQDLQLETPRDSHSVVMVSITHVTPDPLCNLTW